MRRRFVSGGVKINGTWATQRDLSISINLREVLLWNCFNNSTMPIYVKNSRKKNTQYNRFSLKKKKLVPTALGFFATHQARLLLWWFLLGIGIFHRQVLEKISRAFLFWRDMMKLRIFISRIIGYYRAEFPLIFSIVRNRISLSRSSRNKINYSNWTKL